MPDKVLLVFGQCETVCENLDVQDRCVTLSQRGAKEKTELRVALLQFSRTVEIGVTEDSISHVRHCIDK